MECCYKLTVHTTTICKPTWFDMKYHMKMNILLKCSFEEESTRRINIDVEILSALLYIEKSFVNPFPNTYNIQWRKDTNIIISIIYDVWINWNIICRQCNIYCYETHKECQECRFVLVLKPYKVIWLTLISHDTFSVMYFRLCNALIV